MPEGAALVAGEPPLTLSKLMTVAALAAVILVPAKAAARVAAFNAFITITANL
jgi:hypothetical protein